MSKNQGRIIIGLLLVQIGITLVLVPEKNAAAHFAGILLCGLSAWPFMDAFDDVLKQ